MSTVFWDTMLFIYLLEGNKKFSPIVRNLLTRSYLRQDTLLTSYLALAEVLVGLPPGSPSAQTLVKTIEEMGFRFVEFNAASVEPFRLLRKQFGLRAPDALHVACAAGVQVDLFLTGDKELVRKKLHVPGVRFIADFENAPI